MTYRLGKPFVHVDMYAMVNLVAGRRIVPELIQDDFTAGRVAEETVALLTNVERHTRTREALRSVRAQLGDPGASGRAAENSSAQSSRCNRRRVNAAAISASFAFCILHFALQP